ncbi:NAD(P)-dependent dehydrogenase (short-subunit alcohol dehydrogenase family) [Novosphingobium hassiacum]|uniref:NAD(P)-dependent dehydrogenase (Short-subunit alcohol dehydrogenase family) n=1 Tax=Novosphingobium hassiacum TaxID=173676 RepID=A0A7W5ZWT0_9SPHN|nr:SDR family oxidoreductase [Novosphingobium hassiacum]MBB3860906.1 NAD(P)-dependent dehydrogenase (short-subunit alcohol dehydrogenase family) [Novosphingobium hassiacum]
MSPSTSSDHSNQRASFAGRLVFVAGGGSGIGEGIAHAFAATGACVVVADIDPGRASAAAAAIRAEGHKAVGMTLDVTEPGEWGRALDSAEQQFGPLGLLCNSAGVVGAGVPVWDIRPDRFSRLFDITVLGVLHGIRAAVPRMRANGGHIVTVASMAAINSVSGLGDYSAAKAALLGLTDSLSSELEGSGIGASIVMPGLVRTRLRETSAALLGEQETRMPMVSIPTDLYMEPGAVGRIVLEAVTEGERYIFTHEERRAEVARRFAAIEAGFNRLSATHPQQRQHEADQ